MLYFKRTILKLPKNCRKMDRMEFKSGSGDNCISCVLDPALLVWFLCISIDFPGSVSTVKRDKSKWLAFLYVKVATYSWYHFSSDTETKKRQRLDDDDDANMWVVRSCFLGDSANGFFSHGQWQFAEQ